MQRTNKIIGSAIFLMLFTSTVMGQKSRGEETDTLIEIIYEDVEAEPAPIQKVPGGGDEVFVVVEDMPEFPGGEDSMRKFIAANLVYPDSALKNKIEGKVYIKFVVNETGKLTDIKVAKAVGWGFDEEALRVIKSMPDWKPGKQRNKPVKVSYVLPIKFSLN